MLIEQPTTKEQARNQAMEWQQWQSDTPISYAELYEWQVHFLKTGKKYGLLKEFKENGII